MGLFDEESGKPAPVARTGEQGQLPPPPPPPMRSASSLVGLVNQGATCYLNSLIQMLRMTPEFRGPSSQLQALDLQQDAMLMAWDGQMVHGEEPNRGLDSEPVHLDILHENNTNYSSDFPKSMTFAEFRAAVSYLTDIPEKLLVLRKVIHRDQTILLRASDDVPLSKVPLVTSDQVVAEKSIADATYDKDVNKLTLQLHPQDNFMCANGILQAIYPQFHVNLTMDGRQTLAELYTEVSKSCAGLIRPKFTLHRMREVDGVLHLYEELEGPSSQLQALDLQQDAKLFVWDGQTVHGEEPNRGPDSEPIHLDILHENNTNYSLDFPKSMTFAEFRAAVSYLTDIPEKLLVLRKVIHRDRTILLRASDDVPLSKVPLVTSDQVVAEKSIADATYDKDVNKLTLQLHPQDNFMCANGILQAIYPQFHVNLTMDGRQTLAELYTEVSKSCAGLIRPKFTLHRMREVDGVLHLYEELEGPSSQLQALDLQLDAKLFVWDGQTVDGEEPNRGPDSEPIHLDILHENNTNSSLPYPKSMTFAAFRAAVSILTDIPEKLLVLRKVIHRDQTILLRASDDVPLSKVPLVTSDQVVAEKSIADQCRLAKAEQIAVQLVTEDDKLQPNDLLLELMLRVPGSRSYTEPEEIIWHAPNPTYPVDLRQHLAKISAIPAEFLMTAKYFPTNRYWLNINGPQVNTSSKKGKKDDMYMNLRHGPFNLQNGDIIGVKDLRELKPDDDVDDFATEEDFQFFEETRQKNDNKRNSRMEGRQSISEDGESRDSVQAGRQKERGVVIKVKSFQ